MAKYQYMPEYHIQNVSDQRRKLSCMPKVLTLLPQLDAHWTQFRENVFNCEGTKLKNNLRRIEIAIQDSKSKVLLGILYYLAFWKSIYHVSLLLSIPTSEFCACFQEGTNYEKKTTMKF